MTFTFVVSLTFAFSRQMSNFLLDLVYLLSSKSTFRNIWRVKNKNIMPKCPNKKHKYEIKLFSRFFWDECQRNIFLLFTDTENAFSSCATVQFMLNFFWQIKRLKRSILTGSAEKVFWVNQGRIPLDSSHALCLCLQGVNEY